MQNLYFCELNILSFYGILYTLKSLVIYPLLAPSKKLINIAIKCVAGHSFESPDKTDCTEQYN